MYLTNEENYALNTVGCVPNLVLFNGDGMDGLSDGDGEDRHQKGISYVYIQVLYHE